MPLTPLYALIIASALDDITLWLNQANRDQNSLLLFGSLFLLPMFGVVLWMGVIHIRDARTLTPPEPPVVTWIEANIPPDALIEGEHYYYHWLFEYDYVSPLTHTMMNREQYEAMGGFEGVWSQIPIDFYLLDYNLNTCCIMNRLVESGFMAERNYEIVYEQNGIVIYGNPEELMVID